MTKEERQKKVDNFLAYFEGKEFKQKGLVLNQAETITDLPRFIKYHISLIKRSHTKRFSKPYILALFQIKKQLENE